MDITRDNKKTKQAREFQKMAKKLMELWIPTLEDGLHGQKSALRSRAMKLMGLWITKLEYENEAQRLRKEITEWETENDLLNSENCEFAGDAFCDWEFRYDNI